MADRATMEQKRGQPAVRWTGLHVHDLRHIGQQRFDRLAQALDRVGADQKQYGYDNASGAHLGGPSRPTPKVKFGFFLCRRRLRINVPDDTISFAVFFPSKSPASGWRGVDKIAQILPYFLRELS